jgi:hypothetical protein
MRSTGSLPGRHRGVRAGQRNWRLGPAGAFGRRMSGPCSERYRCFGFSGVTAVTATARCRGTVGVHTFRAHGTDGRCVRGRPRPRPAGRGSAAVPRVHGADVVNVASGVSTSTSCGRDRGSEVWWDRVLGVVRLGLQGVECLESAQGDRRKSTVGDLSTQGAVRRPPRNYGVGVPSRPPWE